MFTLTPELATDLPARCPITQQPLIANEIWVVDSLCFSHEAALYYTAKAIGLEIDCALGHAGTPLYPQIHGVFLYAPPSDAPTTHTAAQLHHTTSVEPYTITPDDIKHAGQLSGPLAFPLVPQHREGYRPRHRSTPTVSPQEPKP